MAQFSEHDLTDAVIERLAECDDPRFATIMTSLIRHLHDFVRDVELTEAEWMTAIRFLTEVGQACTDKRQEFILLSDTLGVSILVDAINHRMPTGAVESTVLGPWYIEGAPELPLGSDISNGAAGEPTFYSGRLLSLDGEPIAGGLLDVWSGDGEGLYDMQMPGQTEMLCRGKFRTDAAGRYWFRSIRPTYYRSRPTARSARCLRRWGAIPTAPATFT
jgi:hydroxyquinol 1,2-dioxygenase